MRPRSIILFERIFLTIIAIGVLSGLWTYFHIDEMLPSGIPPGTASMMPVFTGVSLVFGTGINLLLWYFIARRGSNVAKWIYIVLFGFGLLGAIFGLISPTVIIPLVRRLLGLVQIVLEGVCVWLVLRPDATRWFKGGPPTDLHDVFS